MIKHNFQLSLRLCGLWSLHSFVVRVFGFQLRFDDERQRLQTRYQVQVLIRRRIRVHASTRTRRERAINPVDIGGTREKLIEKHFDDTTPAKNKRGVRRPGPVLPFIERTRSWSSKPRRKERTRTTRRKKALTTKANIVVNERVASTFSVP